MIFTLINILGTLGLFVFGMKIMSDAIQSFQNVNFKRYLNQTTKSKYSSIFAGFAITSIIQSSSAFSVILLGFVNARMINLRKAFALMIGSNIGTTTTLWLLLFGFGWQVERIVIPLVAIALPFYLSHKPHYRNWAQILLGFCLIFIGLYFLKTFVPNEEEIYSFFNPTLTKSYQYYFIFLLIGLVITLILQSSSAVTGLVLIALSKSNIPLELAVMMIIGTNIGTTITAHIAAYIGNYTVKIVAVFHSIFNLIGACLVFFFVDFILDFLIQNFAFEDKGIYIAIFHTVFNLIAALFFVFTFGFWLQGGKKFVQYLESKNPLIGKSNYNSAEFYLLEANKEMQKFASLTKQTIHILGRLITESNPKKLDVLKNRIKALEQQGDELEKKVLSHLQNTYNFQNTGQASKEVHNLMDVAKQLENIGDLAIKTADIHLQRRKNNSYITPKLRSLLIDLHNALSYSTNLFIQNINEDRESITLVEAKKAEKKINEQYKESSNSLRRALEKEKIPMLSILFYQELIQNYEIIGDHIFKANQSLVGE